MILSNSFQIIFISGCYCMWVKIIICGNCCVAWTIDVAWFILHLLFVRYTKCFIYLIIVKTELTIPILVSFLNFIMIVIPTFFILNCYTFQYIIHNYFLLAFKFDGYFETILVPVRINFTILVPKVLLGFLNVIIAFFVAIHWFGVWLS